MEEEREKIRSELRKEFEQQLTANMNNTVKNKQPSQGTDNHTGIRKQPKENGNTSMVNATEVIEQLQVLYLYTVQIIVELLGKITSWW